MISARGEVRRDRGEVCLRADLEDQTHANDNVEQEVTMEEPETRIVGSKSEDNVAVVGHGNSVFRGGKISLFQMAL